VYFSPDKGIIEVSKLDFKLFSKIQFVRAKVSVESTCDFVSVAEDARRKKKIRM
jgi:hypothetical protein